MILQLEEQYLPLVGGRFESRSNASFDAIEPATGKHLAKIARGSAADIDAAVRAARQALPGWRDTPAAERAQCLLRLADAIAADIDRLAEIDARDIGRRVSETRMDHEFAISQYRYFAAAVMTLEDFGGATPNGHFIAMREPIGVCGQIIPWNVPAIMTAFKLAPALAAGNTVVLKPDENASLSTLVLAQKLAAIFPPGVVNVVPGFGDEAGAALTAHPGVAKIAFTGSSEIGRVVAAAGAQRLVPVSLELGGKSPNIVFPDIENLEAVVDNAAFAATFCNGQSCLAGTRLFVHNDLYDTFVDKLASGFAQLRVGSPLDARTQVSCLVSAKQGQRVLDYIQIAERDGARLLAGGQRINVPGNEHGYFVAPTIFEAKNDMRIAQEEVFGPVLSVIRWHDFDTMIREANDVRYGLAAGVYTSSLKHAMRTAKALDAGSVWVNQYANLMSGAPFGGNKESGIGREVCRETLHMYSHLKTVTLATETPAPWYL
ncbi:aldehyde dehydrogenase family protein [Pandoraea pneumonica]|uniref:aldehyde dehydrogenase family protein n=1 Tax=Pandoraea pneumonica TaxID=2508299 RepID=UPI003CEA82E2